MLFFRLSETKKINSILRVLKLWPQVRFEVTVCACNLYVRTAMQLQLDSLNETWLDQSPMLAVDKEGVAGERNFIPWKKLLIASFHEILNPQKFMPVRYLRFTYRVT